MAHLLLCQEVLERVSSRGLETTDIPRIWLAAALRTEEVGEPWVFFSEHAQLAALSIRLSRRQEPMPGALASLVHAMRWLRELRKPRSGDYGRLDCGAYLAHLALAVAALGEPHVAARAWVLARFQALSAVPPVTEEHELEP